MSADWFDGNGTGDPVDVAKILDGHATQGIAEIVAAGALVSLGTTSDGGALALTVTVDGRYRREYFRDEDTMLAWIAQAIPAVHTAKGTSSPPGATPKRTRRSGKL